MTFQEYWVVNIRQMLLALSIEFHELTHPEKRSAHLLRYGVMLMMNPITCDNGQSSRECDTQSSHQSRSFGALGSCEPSLGTSSSKWLQRAILWIAGLTVILIGPLSAQQKAIDGQLAVSVQSDPPDPAFVQVPEDPHLPRVLIIGDSISMGYTWEVRKLLAGKANVQHPDVNCGPTELGVKHVKQWIGEKHWDVIYFNFGLHDLKYLDDKGEYVTPDKGKQVASIEQYQANLRRIATILQSTDAKLIFATTTPVPSGSGGRVQGDEIRYNTAAIQVMREMQVEVDDLWSLVNPSLASLQQPHNVHFTAEGYRILGSEVANGIEHDLPRAGQH